MLIRRVWVLLALVLLAAGCAKTPSPVDLPPAQPLPRLLEATLLMLAEQPDGTRAALGERKLEPGDSVIPTDRCVVSFTVGGSPDVDWVRSVRLEGENPPQLDTKVDRGVMEFAIPAGAPGSVVTVTLPPVEGAKETVYRLTRAAAPTARLEVQVGGQWQAADPFAVYPASQLVMQYRFSAPMDRGSVESSLRQEVPGHRQPVMDAAVFAWRDAQTLEVRWAEAPPVISRSLRGAKGQNGLYVAGTVPGVHAGAAPYLASVNPATGAERRVRDLPPEAFFVDTARGGQVLRLDAWELVGGGYPDGRTWLYDLKTGTSRDQPYRWNAVLVEATGALQDRGNDVDGYVRGRLSPDGARQVFTRSPAETVASGTLFTVDVEVGDVNGQGRRVVYEGALVRKGRYEIAPVTAWSPDGKSLAVVSAVDEQNFAVVVVDLVTGGSRNVATVPAFYSWHLLSPSLQWQGRRVLVGESVVDLDAGTTVRQFPGAWAARLLSPDGKHVLLGTYDDATGDGRSWGPITLLGVDSGVKLDLGEGLPAGWSAEGEALIVRWEGRRYRYAQIGL